MQTSLRDRVDEHFRTCYLGTLDAHGMMQHILDSLGALRVLLKSEGEAFPQFAKETFRMAVSEFVNVMVDGEDLECQSAIYRMMDAFPDPKKRRDGRSWLPLHWAAICDGTAEADMSSFIRERPVVVQYDQLSVVVPVEESDPKSVMKPKKFTVFETAGQLPLHLICSVRYPRLSNFLNLLAANPLAPQVADGNGWLPLHWCASNCSHTKMLQLLVEAFPSGVKVSNAQGEVPLQLAARNRHVEALEYLHDIYPPGMDCVDREGNNCLHSAVSHLNPQGVRWILSTKPELALIRNFQDQLPVHRAFFVLANTQMSASADRLKRRRYECIKALLELCPVCAGMGDRTGRLPLHLALLYNCNFDEVKAIYEVCPSAALKEDQSANRYIPVQYTDDPQMQNLLLGMSPSLTKLGLTSSFAKFVL